jgi:proline iminopeptidase
VPLALDLQHDLDANTTSRLIAELEELRTHLGVEGWVINGVSWGSTLAIAYAQAHPERVRGVVAMAVTTTSRWEVDWITEIVGALYPEEWELFVQHAEQAGLGYQRGKERLVEAYRRLMRHPDPAVREAASLAWARWEDAHIAIGAGGFRRDPAWDDRAFRQNFAILVTHYWANDGFCDPPLLDRMQRLAGIPAVLIHGRLDVSGPLRTAWQAHRRWSGSRLVVDEGEGHGGSAMVNAWRQANDDMASRLLAATETS